MSDIIDFEEAVALLKTSKPTLYRWIADGRVKGFKVGREWRFYRSDLVSFVESSDQERETARRELRQAIAVYDRRLRDKGVQP